MQHRVCLQRCMRQPVQQQVSRVAHRAGPQNTGANYQNTDDVVDADYKEV